MLVRGLIRVIGELMQGVFLAPFWCAVAQLILPTFEPVPFPYALQWDTNIRQASAHDYNVRNEEDPDLGIQSHLCCGPRAGAKNKKACARNPVREADRRSRASVCSTVGESRPWLDDGSVTIHCDLVQVSAWLDIERS